jgi:uncharacterized protein (DUF1810 family)
MSSAPFNLQRFVRAQARDHAQALAELRAGRKQTHWIWYVLPQIRGLGASEMARKYGITGLDKARAYLAHPLLGPRLAECVKTISAHADLEASVILGPLDALKYRSCLTLFDLAAGGADAPSLLYVHPVGAPQGFAQGLPAFEDGQRLLGCAVARDG